MARQTTSRRRRLATALHDLVREPKRKAPIHPALVDEARARADLFGSRLADAITRFAGSMTFVCLHVVWFATWIGLGVEHYPYGLLTMIVSLEAIFLSTFVMISQNRGEAKQQAVADAEWKTVQEEDVQNRELIGLSNQILSLTQEMHAMASALVDPASSSTRLDGAAPPPSARVVRAGAGDLSDTGTADPPSRTDAGRTT